MNTRVIKCQEERKLTRWETRKLAGEEEEDEEEEEEEEKVTL